MKRFPLLLLLSLLVLPGAAQDQVLGAEQPKVTLKPQDRVVFVGNTFAERMVEFGNFETLVHQAFPRHELVVRNLGWSGDEVTRRNFRLPLIQYRSDAGWANGVVMWMPRPLNFGDVHSHLADQKASVIFLCFGMNESFAGAAGLDHFAKDLQTFIDELSANKYDGREAPRLILVSPIAHERLGEDLPDPAAHNEQLRLYTARMKEVSEKNHLAFIDLFGPTSELMAEPEHEPLTFNGIHLTEHGDWVVAQLMLEQLGWGGPSRRLKIDAESQKAEATGAEIAKVERVEANLIFHATEQSPTTAPNPTGSKLPETLTKLQPHLTVTNLSAGKYALKIDGRTIAEADAKQWAKGVPLTSGPAQENAEQLRLLIFDKNQQFFYRWRAVNGEYIYGRRKAPFGIVNFPPEMEKLDQIIAELDRKIWEFSARKTTHTYELIKID